MIVTFYSYKGGVGRSMALANVADILARRGARVLMVDFDLEAPGLEQYFEVPQAAARAHAGLIDLLAAFKEALAVGGARQADFHQVENFILPIYQNLPGNGSLDLMPAGRREGADLDRYATAVRSFDWQDFYFNWEGELFFEWLRDELTSKRYDLVLVDSRTGVTEMGGICSYQLADHIIMLCAANKQNLRGTQNVADDFISSRVMARRRDRALGIVVVPARIESRDPNLLEGFLREFDGTFQRYSPRRLTAEGLGARGLMIPYQPELAFEERVVTDPARGGRRTEIVSAFFELARAVILLAPTGSPVSKLPQAADGELPAPKYDVASRFGGYDVHLSGNVAIRDQLERLQLGLTKAGFEVFVDPIEPVPPDEWQRRSELILFHSKVLLLIANGITSAQQVALRSLLRANRGAKNRPVRLIIPPGESDGGLAHALGLDTEAEALVGGPDDPRAIEQLARLIRTLGAVTTGERIAAAKAASAAIPPPPQTPVQSPAPAASSPAAAPSVAPSLPFRGSNPFREQEAAYYFGRYQLVTDLVKAIDAFPRVWLLGPSGSGKTSAVLAGAFPLLRSSSPGRVLESVVMGPDRLPAIAAELGRMPRSAERHVLFLDNFEQALELEPSRRDPIIAAVARLGTDRPDVVVLIGVRSDYIRSLRAPPLSLDPTAASTIQIADFTAAELRAVIEKPAERAGLAYEPGLVERILADAGLQASAICLVQKILSRLWENRREGFLTNSAYERLGGITAVVAGISDTALTRSSGDHAVINRILCRLVTLDVPTPEASPSGTEESRALTVPCRRRRSVPVAELLPAQGDPAACLATIHELIVSGLLVARANEAEEPCVELIHDAAVTPSTPVGTRLSSLVSADKDFLLARQRLDEAITRREGIGGRLLRTAQGWLVSRPIDLNAAELAAIKRAKRLWQRTFAVLTATLVLLVIMGYGGWQASRKAKAEQAILVSIASRGKAIATVAAADKLAKRQAWAAAIDSLNAADSAYPFRDSLLLKRGRAYAGLRENREAISSFNAVLKLNPDLTDALSARADAYFESGDYTRAMADYTDVIRREPKQADAYLGRAAARDRLRGNVDSTLADYTTAFGADSTRIDALFQSASLQQRLGRRSAAIESFQQFFGLAINPNDREAARARLKEMGADTTGSARPLPSPAAQVTVYLQYADRRDSSAVAEIRRQLTHAKSFRVPEPEVIGKDLRVAELRYVPTDERFVKDVLIITEGALAKGGYRIPLEPRALDPKRFPNARPGTLEIWLPPLSRSVYSPNQAKY
jgi:tetratricopeptide (TPR) repeat protein/cellulose biosynthesis protein BcsQ